MPHGISGPYHRSADTFLRDLALELSTMNQNQNQNQTQTHQAAAGVPAAPTSPASTSPTLSWVTTEEDDFQILGRAAQQKEEEEKKEEEEEEEEEKKEEEEENNGNDNEKCKEEYKDDRSTNSSASTKRYSQEAFDTFKYRVADLCAQLWPFRQSLLQKIAATRPGSWLREKCPALLGKFLPGVERRAIAHHRGGSFNRIVSVSIEHRAPPGLLAGPTPEPAQHLMLRVPRDDWARPDREVALLDFIRARSAAIPLPQVVAADYLNVNPLGKPFVIYQRIPGQDLQMGWGRLTHRQRCSVAKDLARIYKEMLTVKHAVPGTVDDFVPAGGRGEEDTGPVMVPMTLQTPHGPEQRGAVRTEVDWDEFCNADASRYSLRSYFFFRNILARRRATDMFQFGATSHRVAVWDQLTELLVEEMRKHPVLRDVDFSLCHLDLQARNIMAAVDGDGDGDDGEAHVTGILDWDSAVLAPQFINCTPPWWMWADRGTHFDEFDESPAKLTPTDPAKAEIKRIFDAECGQTFFRYAYQPEYRLGRILFRLIESGMAFDEQWDNLERFYKKWDTLYDDYRYQNLRF